MAYPQFLFDESGFGELVRRVSATENVYSFIMNLEFIFAK